MELKRNKQKTTIQLIITNKIQKKKEKKKPDGQERRNCKERRKTIEF